MWVVHGAVGWVFTCKGMAIEGLRLRLLVLRAMLAMLLLRDGLQTPRQTNPQR